MGSIAEQAVRQLARPDRARSVSACSWSVHIGCARVCVFGAECACNGMRGARVQRVGRNKQALRQRLHKTRDSVSAGGVFVMAL